MIPDFRKGLFLVAIAVTLWGALPIALQLILPTVDPVTLTWFRFICAFVVAIIIQAASKKLGDFKGLSAKQWGVLTLAMIGSVTNYVLFVVSLNYLSGPTAQLIFQVAPIMMALGGVLFYKERLSALQVMYFVGVIVGMLMFFNRDLDGISGKTQILIGIVCVFFSALSWVVYTLLQKSLINRISSTNILLFIYFGASIVLFPFSAPEKLMLVETELLPVLFFLSLNTLVAYEAFTRSLHYWPVSRIGAALPLVPVAAFLFAYFLHPFWPNHITVDVLNFIAIIGIAMVTICAIGASLSGFKKVQKI